MNSKNMDGGGDYNAIMGPVAVGTRGTVGSLIRKEIEYFRKKNKKMKMKMDSHQLPQPTTFHKLSYISDHHHHQQEATAAAAAATGGSISDNYYNYYNNNNNISNKRKARQSSSTSSSSTSSSSWFFGMKWNLKKKQRVAAAAPAGLGDVVVDKDVVIPPFSYVILKDHHIQPRS